MGQHRTRKQKETAEVRRELRASYSLKGLNLSGNTVAAGAPVNKAALAENAFQAQNKHAMFRDLMKTLAVSGLCLSMLLVLWWKQR